MDTTRFAALPAQLRAAADAITALPDAADLPQVCGVDVEWDEYTATLTLKAQLADSTAEDTDKVGKLNQWAAVLGGDLLLDEEVAETYRPGWCWRNLSARATLPDGTQVNIWTHLRYRVPAHDAAVPVAA